MHDVIRSIIFFTVEIEKLYTVSKRAIEDQELTVAQLMNPLLKNSDLN